VVQRLADRVAVMYLGQIVEEGATERVFAAPEHPYTRALLAAVPSLDPARSRRATASVARGDMPSPTRPPSGCRFHTRCPQAFARCADEAPSLVAVGDGASRCFLSEPSSARDSALDFAQPAVDTPE